MEGIVNIKPIIKKITFSNSELHIKLEDGRKISVPLCRCKFVYRGEIFNRNRYFSSVL